MRNSARVTSSRRRELRRRYSWPSPSSSRYSTRRPSASQGGHHLSPLGDRDVGVELPVHHQQRRDDPVDPVERREAVQ